MAEEDVCRDIANRVKEILPDFQVNYVVYKDLGICRVDFYNPNYIRMLRNRNAPDVEGMSFLEYDMNKGEVIKVDLNRPVSKKIDVFYLDGIKVPYGLAVDYLHRSIEIDSIGSMPLGLALDMIARFHRSEYEMIQELKEWY